MLLLITFVFAEHVSKTFISNYYTDEVGWGLFVAGAFLPLYAIL